jgi:hypothetical protein
MGPDDSIVGLEKLLNENSVNYSKDNRNKRSRAAA